MPPIRNSSTPRPPNYNRPLILPEAFDRFGTRKCIPGIRCSDHGGVYNGSATRQYAELCEGIREAGGSVVSLTRRIGRERSESGKLDSERSELIRGVRLTEHHDAILVFRDPPRLLRPADFDAQDNQFAEPTDEDYEALWA